MTHARRRAFLPAGPVGPLAVRAHRRSRRAARRAAVAELDPARARACPACRCGSSGRAPSRPPRSSPSAGAAAASSSPATPPTASRRAAGPGSTSRCTTATTSAGSSRWVLRGWARAGAARHATRPSAGPVAEYTAARSADPDGSLRPPEHEVRADLGGRIRHAWSGGASTLDLLGPGLTLFAARGAAPPRGRTLGPPITVRELDPIAARAVGAPVLVRSDGTPVRPGARRTASSGRAR